MRTRVMTVLALILVKAIALAQSVPGGGYVVVLAGSKEYHWPTCPLLADAKGLTVLTRAQANGKGYKPHADCNPANAPAATPSTTPGATAAGKTAGPTYVYVAKSDKLYHRAECKVLPKDAKRMVLDKDAVKGRWPCTVCKPPIRAAGPRAVP